MSQLKVGDRVIFTGTVQTINHVGRRVEVNFDKANSSGTWWFNEEELTKAPPSYRPATKEDAGQDKECRCMDEGDTHWTKEDRIFLAVLPTGKYACWNKATHAVQTWDICEVLAND